MFRQSPGRNQRSKGIKIKHVLQLCFLIAICFWLLYQVKHSHDKKKEFDESDAKVSVRTQTSNEMLKFGRKDLQQPKVDEIATTTSIINKKQNEEAEEEEEEEKKHEEVQQEEEQKLDDKEDEEGKGEGVGVGEEDELPEHEIEKSDPEIDGEEDATEEEKEKESEENDNESSLDDRDDEDGSAKGTHEAREELYKADDASSAVTHETQISADETDNEDSNEHPEMDKSANETEKNATTYSKTQEREMIENNPPPLDTISKSENSSMEAQSDGPLVKNTTEVIREADGSTIQNVTVDGKPPGGGSDTENISSSSEETSSKAINSSSIVTEDNSQTSTAGSDNTTDSENLDSDTVKTENPEVVQNDPIDSSDSSVAVRTDLETLPHIQAEATTNDEDAAAE